MNSDTYISQAMALMANNKKKLSDNINSQPKLIDGLAFPNLLRELENLKLPSFKYIIGVDDYDKQIKSYCLMRVSDSGVSEVLISKVIREEEVYKSIKSDFQKEVENLSKYFNAKIIK